MTNLKCVDLSLELIAVLPGDLLAGDLPLHLVQPAVERVEVLPGLPELLLDRLLRGAGKRGRLVHGAEMGHLQDRIVIPLYPRLRNNTDYT